MNSLVLHSSIAFYYVTVWFVLLPLMLKPAGNVQEDERIATMRSIGSRFLTIWNLVFQTAVFFGYLVCDILEVKQKYTPFRRKFKHVLDEFFYSITVPNTILVVILFWIFYSFDSGLVFIYPNLIGDTLTPWANHAMHTNILPVALLQVYHNKVSPVPYSTTQKRLIMIFILYVTCLYGTYLEKNVWVYPFLNYLFEPLRLIFLVLMAVLLQGINFVFHGLNERYCSSSFGSAKEAVKRKAKNH